MSNGIKKKEEHSMPTMEELMLKPLDMPIGDVEITTPLLSMRTSASGRGERYTLWSTRADVSTFVPSKVSLGIFAPESSAKIDEEERNS